MDKKYISFFKSKDYIFIKDIGSGGTGITKLIKDPTIDEEFVCKKYETIYSIYQETFYDNFVDEIKILYKINHPNIVRIFSYYLYPEKLTGYILMEYIKGSHIDRYINLNPSKINDIFIQVIEGFKYLQEKNILHRDIRPSNILVTIDGVVKIIDFGFGKPINNYEDYIKSISLNWAYTLPDDFNISIYDFKTEIYFIGKLFEKIIEENNIGHIFNYNHIIKSMIANYNTRVDSFNTILVNIKSESYNYVDFTDKEKLIYSNYAEALTSICSSFKSSIKYKSDIDNIADCFYSLIQKSILETHIQDNSLIISCLVEGGYRYYHKIKVTTECISLFFNWWNRLDKELKIIVLSNLWLRLDNIKREEDYKDLPF